MKNRQYIGVFDSGVGGLSVLKALYAKFPNENFIYLGDTARLPYGTKSKETIKNYVLKNISHLTSRYNIKAVVVACNSASSVLDEVSVDVKTIGVIKAGSRDALEKTSSKKIGLWATKATVLSGSYEKEILSLSPEAKVKAVSASLLVTLVEEGSKEHPLLYPSFEYYLKPFLGEIDTLILGCTHFPFFREELSNYLKEKNIKIRLSDAAEKISKEVEPFTDASLKPSGTLKVLITDNAPHFTQFIKENLSEVAEFQIEKIDL